MGVAIPQPFEREFTSGFERGVLGQDVQPQRSGSKQASCQSFSDAFLITNPAVDVVFLNRFRQLSSYSMPIPFGHISGKGLGDY